MKSFLTALLSSAAFAKRHSLAAWEQSNTKTNTDATYLFSSDMTAEVEIGYELPIQWAANDIDIEVEQSIFASSYFDWTFGFAFYNDSSDTIFSLFIDANIIPAEFYVFDNVLTFLYDEKSFCDKLSWWYDVLSVSVGAVFTFDECYFGLYDYIDADTSHSCGSTDYALDDVWTKVYGPSADGWYGVNTCDAEEETEVTDITDVTDETDTTTDTTDAEAGDVAAEVL